MLSIYDYLVIGFYFVFMAVIGIVCRKFIGNTSDYFRGGGKMLWWMAGSSAFMVSFSAWTFTGAASKAYEDGPVIMILFFANAAGFLVNYLYFAARFRQMRTITALEAVRTRFGKGSEQFFTWVQMPLGILYAGIWLNGLSVFLAAAFGLDLRATIMVTGVGVLIMAVVGGSWAVVVGDFMQMLILMPVTVVAAVLAIAHVGGWTSFLEKLPQHHLHWSEGARMEILILWVVAIFIKQFISTNNMLEASRYLNVKDSGQARKAALLAMGLFLVGPLVWFIPPMAASITHPDLGSVFPQLAKPSEAAFVASALDTMPAGMVGLLISGIFAATMSSMDAGLNKNAGFFVKNFYHVVLRPGAHDKEQLFVSKLVTLLMGILVILAALLFSTWKDITLFNLMLQFGGLIALPYCVPLIWGTLVKRAPAWAGWTTVLVGFATSLAGRQFLTPTWLQNFLGWTTPLTPREQDDWVLLLGVLLNAVVCSAWFLGTCLLARSRSVQEVERVSKFFTQINTPVDFDKEEGSGNDAQQCRTLGVMCLIYGGFLLLLVLIPNPTGGRLGIFACAASILGVGGLLYWNALRLNRRASGERPQTQPTVPLIHEHQTKLRKSWET
jgi:Na+/proline symporter